MPGVPNKSILIPYEKEIKELRGQSFLPTRLRFGAGFEEIVEGLPIGGAGLGLFGLTNAVQASRPTDRRTRLPRPLAGEDSGTVAKSFRGFDSFGEVDMSTHRPPFRYHLRYHMSLSCCK